MEISVIIPTHQRPQLLMKCLTALLKQKFDKQRFEVIVVSDGPDPETHSLVRSMAQCGMATLRYFSLPTRRGPAAARNYGWLGASGKIIAFTDDDCLPDEHWLKELYENINPDIPEA